jgi:hypothetical protein
MDYLNGLSFLRRLRWKTFMISFVLIGLSFAMFSPVKTVKALLVDSGVGPANNNEYLSMDGGRVAYIAGIAPSSKIGVYDTNSASGTTFATANQSLATLPPSISGDKIVDPLSSSIATPVTLYYCTLPHASPIQPCGAWTSIVTGLPSIATLAFYASFPEVSGDIVVWANASSFDFYRFSSGTVTAVSTPTQPRSVTTNGAIIAFDSKPTSTSSSETIHYYDASLPAASRSVVDTGLAGYSASITQNTIAFNDNSTTGEHLRYYDISRNLASPAGTGPVGSVSYASNPSIWGNRIVFSVSETTDNFDCNGDGTISSGDSCLGLWNIRGPSYIATTIAASAAPGVKSNPAINDGTVAFVGSNGNIQYVTVPMRGDVNQDGIVNTTDKTLVTNCLNQVLKGSVC